MSSATSINRAEASAPDAGFHVWHFFVLLSLVAATVAVIMARQSTPQHLILISLAVGAAGLAAYACYRMLAPLALSNPSILAEPVGERLRTDLEREKSLVLRSIKELEFDRAMGKLSVKDFEEMSGRLRSRAIGIMKQLEGGSYREIIERDLAARLKSTGRLPAPSRPDLPAFAKGPAEQQVGRAACQQPGGEQQDLAIGGCVCGIQHDTDAKFCKACGARVA